MTSSITLKWTKPDVYTVYANPYVAAGDKASLEHTLNFLPSPKKNQLTPRFYFQCELMQRSGFQQRRQIHRAFVTQFVPVLRIPRVNKQIQLLVVDQIQFETFVPVENQITSPDLNQASNYFRGACNVIYLRQCALCAPYRTPKRSTNREDRPKYRLGVKTLKSEYKSLCAFTCNARRSTAWCDRSGCRRCSS